MLVQWPRSGAAWDWPAQGHIDGYGPGGWSGGFMLGATAYLDDVEANGGAFIYWPQSHLPTHAYFRENPAHIDGSFRDREDWEPRQWGLFSDRSPHGPEQFVARAGDVIFWHCFLCHTGSTNIRSKPRLGLFARWHYAEREDYALRGAGGPVEVLGDLERLPRPPVNLPVSTKSSNFCNIMPATIHLSSSGATMAKSMFSREVALKLEGELNAFQACRSLSHRARDINTERNLHEAEGEIPEEDQPNSSASAMLDFAEGRIAILPEERADSDEA